MRGKWVLVTGALIAIVVAGGFGGLTRAYAGVKHWMGTTTTTTRFCVYVDRSSPPDSYGDLTVVPKYGHKTCIVGKKGADGNSTVITWNKTVATPAAPIGAKHRGFGSVQHYVDLATVGPFTVRGYCGSSDGVYAETDVLSAQDGSSLAWDDSMYAGNFNSGDGHRVSNYANGGTDSPSLVTEYQNGEFTATTGDQKTALTGFAGNGVYIQGSEGPACSFIGHLVIENGPAAS
jgi:hypothetical protein